MGEGWSPATRNFINGHPKPVLLFWFFDGFQPAVFKFNGHSFTTRVSVS